MAVHRVVVDVMLKPEILDPAGQAVLNALPALGLPPAQSLRIGKHVELALEAEGEQAALERATKMAEVLLANPVIEDFRVRLADGG
jgi:phosphoribosylformylglycinamidine synthase PurS subunit